MAKVPITGRVHQTATLETAGGQPFTVSVLTPDPGLQNAQEIRRQERQWEALAQDYGRRRLDPDLVRRSHFGAEVLYLAAKEVYAGHPGVLLAQTPEGQVVGVLLYTMQAERRPPRGSVSLMAVHPAHLAGAPGSAQVRGIGTTMTQVVGQFFVESGVETVFLHPLDEAARRFWEGRGFHDRVARGAPLRLDTPVEIAQLAARCGHEHPDKPDAGDNLLVGSFEELEGVRLPELKGRF